METTGYFDDIKELFRENDRRRAQENRERDERRDSEKIDIDRRLKELSVQIGRLGNRLGEFVEELVRPSLVRLFRERGIEVHSTLRDLSAKQGDMAAQIDLVAINDEEVVLVEVKSRLERRDVDEHVERIGKFRPLFPRFADARVLGAVAAMTVTSEALAHAEQRGLFVLAPSGNDMTLLNSAEFEPHLW